MSVPFCRTKCSFCNFASDVFSKSKMQGYVDRVIADMERAPVVAEEFEAELPRAVDSVYVGGGTPSILAPEQMVQLFEAARKNFEVRADSEVTVECAPGTLTPEMIATLVRCGVNRVSLGVQSFVDQEARAVGRLHTREIVLDDIARLRAAGITEISVDLIAGLPHQTRESWSKSLDDMIATGVPHVSVYILEVDEDSRLGKELLAGGQRYHAHFVPNEDDVADFYELACERLNAAGIAQYEISNFARAGHESKHNLKYWTRQPYVGFGADAHSMLLAAPHFKAQGMNAIRLFAPSELEEYLTWDGKHGDELISELSALEETMFLGLRLNRGVDLNEIEKRFTAGDVEMKMERVLDLLDAKLVEFQGRTLKLTARGRLLSNEVFEKFISIGTVDDLREILGLDPDAPLPQIDFPNKIQ